MNTNTLNLSASCRLEVIKYDGIGVDVCLEYVEHSTDHYSSDNTTTIYIDSEMAQKIIELLRSAHDGR